MQPINGFESVQAVHGRSGGMLPGGTYAMVITAAKEDTTGYGNQSVRIAYDVCEGEHKGKYADIAGDPEQNWRHEVEIDVQEANGARFKALVDAVVASNPGYVWDWNEAGLVGKYVGLVLQERKVTLTRGKNKGQDRTYLDFWDAVPVQSVLDGSCVIVPPVNDRRTSKTEDARPQQPVAVPTTYAQANPAPQPMAQMPMPPQPTPVQQMPQAVPPMQMPAQQQYQMPMQQQMQHGYQQQPVVQVPVPQGYQQAAMDMADEDIPF